LQGNSSSLSPEAEVKHSVSSWSKVLLPLAVAAAAGIAVPAAAAQAGSASASTASAQSTCSLNPSPPPGFTERKVQVNGIGINYVRGGHGPTLLLLHGYPATWTEWDDILPALALEQPGHLRASIEWFSTLPQDVTDDAIYQKTKLTMPVLAIGGSASLGSSVAAQVREYAANVTGVVVPDTGHWLYEERPAELTEILLQFLQ
jgi:pimeloyl-ACP methyl ester carboxylesterase